MGQAHCRGGSACDGSCGGGRGWQAPRALCGEAPPPAHVTLPATHVHRSHSPRCPQRWACGSHNTDRGINLGCGPRQPHSEAPVWNRWPRSEGGVGAWPAPPAQRQLLGRVAQPGSGRRRLRPALRPLLVLGDLSGNLSVGGREGPREGVSVERGGTWGRGECGGAGAGDAVAATPCPLPPASRQPGHTAQGTGTAPRGCPAPSHTSCERRPQPVSGEKTRVRVTFLRAPKPAASAAQGGPRGAALRVPRPWLFRGRGRCGARTPRPRLTPRLPNLRDSLLLREAPHGGGTRGDQAAAGAYPRATEPVRGDVRPGEDGRDRLPGH